jgi:hypothetical protein
MNKLEYQQVEQVGIRNQHDEMLTMLRFQQVEQVGIYLVYPRVEQVVIHCHVQRVQYVAFQQVEQVGTPMSCAQFA